MDFYQARAGENGALLGGGLGVIPIPPYPSYAAYPVNYATNGQGQYYRIDPSQKPDAALFDSYGLKIWRDAHTEDAKYGSDLTPPRPGTPRWDVWFKWNGQANSLGTPLPFPQLPDVYTWFPKYAPNATPQDVAPGEFAPPSACDQYRADGLREISRVRAQYFTGQPAGTRVAGMSEQNMVDNVMIDYNEEAARNGCTTPPFPEAVGKVRALEVYDDGPSAPLTPVNTFTPSDGGPTAILTPDGSNVPVWSPPPSPVLPPVITPTDPVLNLTPDDGVTLPTGGTPSTPVSSASSFPLSLMALAGAAIVLLTRRRR